MCETIVQIELVQIDTKKFFACQSVHNVRYIYVYDQKKKKNRKRKSDRKKKTLKSHFHFHATVFDWFSFLFKEKKLSAIHKNEIEAWILWIIKIDRRKKIK